MADRRSDPRHTQRVMVLAVSITVRPSLRPGFRRRKTRCQTTAFSARKTSRDRLRARKANDGRCEVCRGPRNRLEKGSTVVVTLSTAANVRLMDSSDLASYKAARRTEGVVRSAPFRVTVPEIGICYLAIDLMALKATSIRDSATVQPPPLGPTTSPVQSLSGIRHERPPVLPDGNGETWVFSSPTPEKANNQAQSRSQLIFVRVGRRFG